jgi:hypothetical protein
MERRGRWLAVIGPAISEAGAGYRLQAALTSRRAARSIKAVTEVRMQTRHDADRTPSRPTAAWIRHYAADLLAAAPGMRPLDAVRQAMEVSEKASAPETRATQPPASGRRPPAR